jgi:hypothetical protein
MVSNKSVYNLHMHFSLGFPGKSFLYFRRNRNSDEILSQFR